MRDHGPPTPLLSFSSAFAGTFLQAWDWAAWKNGWLPGWRDGWKVAGRLCPEQGAGPEGWGCPVGDICHQVAWCHMLDTAGLVCQPGAVLQDGVCPGLDPLPCCSGKCQAPHRARPHPSSTSPSAESTLGLRQELSPPQHRCGPALPALSPVLGVWVCVEQHLYPSPTPSPSAPVSVPQLIPAPLSAQCPLPPWPYLHYARLVSVVC